MGYFSKTSWNLGPLRPQVKDLWWTQMAEIRFPTIELSLFSCLCGQQGLCFIQKAKGRGQTWSQHPESPALAQDWRASVCVYFVCMHMCVHVCCIYVAWCVLWRAYVYMCVWYGVSSAACILMSLWSSEGKEEEPPILEGHARGKEEGVSWVDSAVQSHRESDRGLKHECHLELLHLLRCERPRWGCLHNWGAAFIQVPSPSREAL